MGVDLVRECQRCLAQAADEVEGGLLYVDEGVGEALHYVGGLPFLLQLGVRSVCSLENASPLDAAVAWEGGRLQKVVILTARLLSDAHRYILRCLRCHPSVKKCTIFTSISQEGHSACFETPLGHNAFSEYASLLQQDLQSKKLAADESFTHGDNKSDELELVVKHAPLLMCALTPNLFVLPSGGAEAEAPLSDHKTDASLGPGLPAIDTGVTFDVDDRIPSGASLLGHFLQQMTAQLDVKVDVFSLGPLAHLVGNLVTDLSTSTVLDHGSQRKSAGLLLVDRSLDLITPTCHNDNFLDLVVYSLLRRPTVLPPSRPQTTGNESEPVARKPMDFRVPTESRQNGGNGGSEFPLFPRMAGWDCKTQENLLSIQNDSSTGPAEEDKAQVMGGSIAAPWDQFGLFSLDSMLDKSTKDATLMLRKWFHEALRSEKQPIPEKARLGAMNSAELASLKTALSSKPDMTIRHLDLLQVARAMEEVRSGDKRSKWEAVSSAEKILRLTVNDGSQSIALQLSDMVQQISNDGMLDLSDVLTLAIVGYALAGEASPKGFSNGPFSWEEEAVLKDSLLNAILKGSSNFCFPRRLKRALETHWEKSKGKSARDKAKNAEKDVEVNDDWGEWEGEEEEEESEDGDYLEAHLKLEIRDWLQELISRLHCISQARARLPASLRSTEEQVFAVGLLQRIFSLIFSKSDVPGLHHHISSVGRIFKSGLGRFGLGQPKSKLGDHKLIIIFVIGGISGSEIRDIKEAQVGLQGAEGVEVLIGGTTFLSPSDMRDLLLASNSAL